MRVTIRQPRYCQARTKKIFDSGDEKYFVLLSHHLMEAEAQWKLFQLIILNIGSHPPSIAPSLHTTHTVTTIHFFWYPTSRIIPVWTTVNNIGGRIILVRACKSNPFDIVPAAWLQMCTSNSGKLFVYSEIRTFSIHKWPLFLLSY